MVSGVTRFVPGKTESQKREFFLEQIRQRQRGATGIVVRGGFTGGRPTSRREAQQDAAAKSQAVLESQQQAVLESQQQAEIQRQQNIQQRNQTIQQAVITSRRPTISTGGQPVRDVELGMKVAEFNRRSFEEAKKQGRDLTIREKEKIVRDLNIPKEEVIKTETRVSTSGEITPGSTGVSNIKTLRERFIELPGVRILTSFERGKQERGPLIDSKIENKLSNILRLETKDSGIKHKGGFSLTQKFFEFAPQILRTGFTKEGKFKRIEPIRFEGGNNKPIVGELASPLEVKIGSGIISLADIIFKGQVFASFLSTGAVRKDTGKARQKTTQKSKQELKTSGVRFDSPTAEEVVGKFEKVFVKEGRAGVEKRLVEAFKGIKTEEGRRGFAELTKTLLEKELIGQPSFKVTTPPVVRTSFPQPPRVEILFDIIKINAPQLTPQQIASSLGSGSLLKDKPSKQKPFQIEVPKASTILSEIPTTSTTTKTKTLTLSQLMQGQKTQQKLATSSIFNQGSKQDLATAQPQIQLPQLTTPQQTLQQNLPQLTTALNLPTMPKPPKINKIPIIPFKFRTSFKMPKEKIGKFPVFGRRKGEFKIIGTGRTEKEAFSLGRKFVGKTLAATFKIPKSKITKLPGFRTKRFKGQTLFIEPRRRRLKKSGREVLEIQSFKKPKKKRKGGKKK